MPWACPPLFYCSPVMSTATSAMQTLTVQTVTVGHFTLPITSLLINVESETGRASDLLNTSLSAPDEDSQKKNQIISGVESGLEKRGKHAGRGGEGVGSLGLSHHRQHMLHHINLVRAVGGEMKGRGSQRVRL